mmetsp:Transcript_140072/g.314564  ORF Transcript_140072/g.314564 Transcript_140072/m.314564 type:complete len:217 (-) Transcript_140072:839-1489(-)
MSELTLETVGSVRAPQSTPESGVRCPDPAAESRPSCVFNVAFSQISCSTILSRAIRAKTSAKTPPWSLSQRSSEERTFSAVGSTAGTTPPATSPGPSGLAALCQGARGLGVAPTEIFIACEVSTMAMHDRSSCCAFLSAASAAAAARNRSSCKGAGATSCKRFTCLMSMQRSAMNNVRLLSPKRSIRGSTQNTSDIPPSQMASKRTAFKAPCRRSD